MHLLVIGHKGQLGTDFCAYAQAAGHTVAGFDFPEIDITNIDSIEKVVFAQRPEVIINCAAFTAVDQCEVDQIKAYSVNADGVRNIGKAAHKAGVRVVHISTDYVFDGLNGPYVESSIPCPRSVYGKSKYAAEIALLQECPKSQIFRIAWLYGLHGVNFVKTIRSIAKQRGASGQVLRVVHDQFGSPTWTVEVVRQILEVIDLPEYGIFHCTAEGSCSWFDFARAIIDAAGIRCTLEPCTTAEFPRPAPRPANSILENERLKKLNKNIMKPWQDAFAEFCHEEQKGN